MKSKTKYVYFRISFFLIIVFFFYLLPHETNAKYYTKEEIRAIMSLVTSSAVYAKSRDNFPLYASPDVYSNIVCQIEKGTELEILKDKTMKWYKVKDNLSGNEGWISVDCILIPEDVPTNTFKMNKEEIEGFINLMDFKSDTRYFVWTDISRQETHVLKGKKNNWVLLKTLVCSTGKNISPTTRGLFTLKERGLWFYSERLKSGGKYWVRFNGTYLFHSLAMDRDKNIIDSVVGEKRSNGCIRLNISDAKWFYENVPDTSSVFIY